MPSKTIAAARRPGEWEIDVAAMAGSLVHEIKNPLSTIHINCQLLLEDYPEPQTPREERTLRRLKVISSETQRLEQVVQAFLRFTERHELRREPSDLNALLEDLAEFVSPEAERGNVRVRLGLAPELPRCAFDPELVRQVFLNLVQNALQAMSPMGGGELIFRTRSEEIDGRRWVAGEVIDTGPGISERGLEKLFELYYSTRENGSGLGLAISKRIVDEHRGFLKVDSEEGKGSRFSVYLPLEREGETE